MEQSVYQRQEEEREMSLMQMKYEQMQDFLSDVAKRKAMIEQKSQQKSDQILEHETALEQANLDLELL